MGKFAVIDTETNWADQVMSIGTVIADSDTFRPIEMKYHIPAFFLIFDIYFKTFKVIQGTTCAPSQIRLLIPVEKESSQPSFGKLAAFDIST